MARSACEQAADDPLGPDRAGAAGARLDPALRRARLRPAVARLLDLAPLHAAGRPRGDPRPALRLVAPPPQHLFIEEAFDRLLDVRLAAAAGDAVGLADVEHRVERAVRLLQLV